MGPEDKFSFHPIDIVGTKHTRVKLFLLLLPSYNSYLFQVEGITIANSAYHSLMLVNSYQPEDPTCDPDFPNNISVLAPIFELPLKTITIVTRRSFSVELSKLFKVFVTNEETHTLLSC